MKILTIGSNRRVLDFPENSCMRKVQALMLFVSAIQGENLIHQHQHHGSPHYHYHDGLCNILSKVCISGGSGNTTGVLDESGEAPSSVQDSDSELDISEIMLRCCEWGLSENHW